MDQSMESTQDQTTYPRLQRVAKWGAVCVNLDVGLLLHFDPGGNGATTKYNLQQGRVSLEDVMDDIEQIPITCVSVVVVIGVDCSEDEGFKDFFNRIYGDLSETWLALVMDVDKILGKLRDVGLTLTFKELRERVNKNVSEEILNLTKIVEVADNGWRMGIQNATDLLRP